MGANEIKQLLTQLKNKFGDCSRSIFLQKLKARFSADKSSAASSEESVVANESAETRQNDYLPYLPENGSDAADIAEVSGDLELPEPIDINSTAAWEDHVNRIKDVSSLQDCLDNYRLLSEENDNVKILFNSVNRTLKTDIPKNVKKLFSEVPELDEDTNEFVAEQTGKFVQKSVIDLLRGCYSGIKYSHGTLKKFYESFTEYVENYLASVGVYRKDVKPGMVHKDYIKWFEPPILLENSDSNRSNVIAEIKLVPHYISYLNENSEREELILKGSCAVFAEPGRK